MERGRGGTGWETLGGALARLACGDLEDCARLLGHPDPRVRENALVEFEQRGAGAVAYCERVAGLLGDADPGVRQRAVLAFQGIGRGAAPVLNRVRRAPAAGPWVRAGALAALAEIGGPGMLDPADLAAVRRLRRVKQRTEVPEPFTLCGFWYAVPTVDQAAVLDAFGLAEAEPVTLRTGAAAWCRDRHIRGRGAERASHSRVFVSPGLDGWTLVFGHSSEDLRLVRRGGGCAGGTVRRIVPARCSALGGRFGAAQWYGASCGGAWTAWCIAEGPEVVRYYDVFDAERGGDKGPAHRAEYGYLPAHERVGRAELSGEPCSATAVAARLSVDPAALGPGTAVTGSGVLALTSYGRRYGHPPGALPV
ncbi:hypothetical protein [Streptomyces qinzhouensis]|uniref:HEAT repeat domain-containing protein n=1 Tax=Streptomyces qinzhouensis TaxID=2599401 RepID=A0A5B8IF57_9ACTN|nr:hypothetical protein [Streptomyces qinzhouensis]QDY77218.1 hypothetical protein FQU76_12595 [Streptomyces qinzhouensis]